MAVALASALAVAVLWRVFVVTWAGQRVEDAAFDGARYGQGRLWAVAEPVLDVVSVGFVGAVLLASVLIAAVRRRWSLAVQVAVLVGGANLTTQGVKRLLERPDHGVGADYGNTLPSGHTTVAASVSAALLLVVPPRARPLVAVVGAGYTSATGVSTLVGQWHRPADVVAAVLVVLAWVALVCGAMALAPAPATATAALAQVEGGDRWWRRTRTAAAALVVAAVGTGAFALAMLARAWAVRGDAPSGRTDLAAYAGGVSAVIAASCLTFALMLVLRHAAGSRDGTAAAPA
ncbi:phosphatase PAP2 family protein [Cellulomonas shaoxiangyii]|uniref:phosphatase PAP2 family protein n=1 Tax=Cellulomonas shaoxiangyii TaxID=2566013 RepID=UPI001FCA4241|nr:phosphatase PAP2 family protein [Cellulomonas shaoxiangyii]